MLGRDSSKSNEKHTYYFIRFVDSGYEDSVRGDAISSGYIKDNLSKTICGVGSVGYINTRDHMHEYKIWSNMIHRCYDKKDMSYKYYGEIGVTVCERWHRFDYFYEDMTEIPGYDKELFDNRLLRLDKDILSNGQKIYSPDTTLWVTDEINQKQRTKEYNIKNRKYALFPDGHSELILNMTEFCKTHNLHRQNVNLCLAGKQNSTKGFKFYKEQS